MNFLPDVYIECEECKGRRYNRETLEVKYKGKSIADVLDMSVEEALALFENIPSIQSNLEMLSRVGPDYVKLGQSATTLSGGEAQRIKLTGNLRRGRPGKRSTCWTSRPPGSLRRHEETDQSARQTSWRRATPWS